jgi:hypothetical protein
VIEGIAAELRDRAVAATDAGGYFAAMYARVTRRIALGIAEGRFEDPERMDRFASTFAGHYLRAVGSPADAPRCWRASWDVAGDADLLIVQHLLLGINAHVNHDLGLAVVDLAGPAPADLAAIRPDFDLVNLVLAETQEGVMADLGRVSRWTHLADRLLGGRLFHFSLTVARDQAWRTAVRLHATDPAERPADIAELDRLVSVVAYRITRPPSLATPLLRLARRLEERDHARVVRALLGEAT